MRMKRITYILIISWLAVSLCGNAAFAQEKADTLSLDEVVLKALKNNNLIRASKLKEEEMRQKVKETNIKLYPSVTLNSMYMYRFNLGALSFPEGAFGTLPLPEGTLMLPGQPIYREIGKHNTLIAGTTLYQPLLQLPKITTGVKIAQIDEALAGLEYTKTELQVVNGVERLFYGILAVRKRKVAAEKRIEALSRKLYDVESAFLSGKTVEANTVGMEADVSGRKQDLLELDNEENDYLAELNTLTGIDFRDIPFRDEGIYPIQDSVADYLDEAAANNVDVRISTLQMAKSEQGIKAARRDYLPDVGLMAGYAYQNSLSILSENNPYVGISFSWNLQNLFGNSKVTKQRKLKHQQAVEYNEYVHKDIAAKVGKAYRQLKESEHLMEVAAQAVDFQRHNLDIAYDKQDAGLNTPTDVLEAEAEFAKSEADYYAAKQSYLITLADLRMLTSDTATHQ